MTTPANLIDLHTGLPVSGLTAHEHAGFELGWDHARYDLALPAPYANEDSPLRKGWLAAAQAFGARTLAPSRHVRKWLQLRLHAWLRGRSVEGIQVTPNYLQQIDVTHCPITRVPLSHPALQTSDGSVDRVRNDAGYAAGNLAMMSVKANHAKGAWGRGDALRFAEQAESESLAGIAGLTAMQWRRVAVLCSYVEPLDHEEASAVPMLVLPPNRVRLFNPVQALQAFVSRQFLKAGWSQRISRLEDLLPGPAVRRDFKSFFMTLLPRVIEASRGLRAAAGSEELATRWAVEDAWQASLVQQRWTRFARQLDAAQCESILARAAARRLGAGEMMAMPDVAATDGWRVETRGYLPHGPAPVDRQRDFAF